MNSPNWLANRLQSEGYSDSTQRPIHQTSKEGEGADNTSTKFDNEWKRLDSLRVFPSSHNMKIGSSCSIWGTSVELW